MRDGLFSRRRPTFQDRLQSLSYELTQVSSLDEIITRLDACIKPVLKPARLYIFLLDPLTDQFAAVASAPGLEQSDLRFAHDGALADYLTAWQKPLILAKDRPLPPGLAAEAARISLLDARLLVPLNGRKQLTGWLVLSGRRSTPYRPTEISYLDSLSKLAAPAVERSRVLADLQRRVHEMNVLARVAQGINVTLNFDDILELIFAQTSQLVPVDHFRITLHSEITSTNRHVFYLEGQERLSAEENRIVPPGLGLEEDVIRSGRPIHTDDYDGECRRRSVMPAQRDIYAWLGVPLNAGTRTIGALCLGSRDAAIVYTAEQVEIIRSIADQAAGAIVKTQLLEELERRACQLETLNQLARSLTLELELDPLLNRILNSAIEIFGCEAGTLFLIDEDTGEIVFAAVAGGAENLAGTRLPPGTGIVGKCVQTRRPIIENEVQASKVWFARTDQDTGFQTRSLLVVPMLVGDEMLGVIEVINKRDLSPFTPDDERLLTAFSAHAAVAIQNARLFTMTDQALAARVDELSVMQRIDRELNTSLDLARALRITLDWAMRQSRADAGLVAFIESDRLQIAGSQGYPARLMEANGQDPLSGLEIVRHALQQNQPRTVLTSNGPAGLLADGESQFAVPILRESSPVGVLLLESRSRSVFTTGMLEFLDRLSDHAAIAIANARLYGELEEANLAKSDFISFVSHELKTPMTSIRGYADLLAQGALGEVNEAQAGFLAIIRSNVNRMATLVSDLADISRIEAGRLRLDFGAVSMPEVVDEVIRSTRRQIDEKDLRLELEMPDSLPPVWGDRVRLVQILSNLVSNAVKYTPDHGLIRIQAGARQGKKLQAGPVEFIELGIADSGIGIRPEDQGQIFTKFFRSEDPKAREVTGTGLGLNITKSLVEMQGGSIWFESAYRKGSTFYFTVPVAELAAAP